MKLSHQFKSEGTGGKRIFDVVMKKPENWDENKKALVSENIGVRAQCCVVRMLSGEKKGLNV